MLLFDYAYGERINIGSNLYLVLLRIRESLSLKYSSSKFFKQDLNLGHYKILPFLCLKETNILTYLSALLFKLISLNEHIFILLLVTYNLLLKQIRLIGLLISVLICFQNIFLGVENPITRKYQEKCTSN